MLIHVGLEGLRPEWSGSVVGIGTFDGVHAGHQALIREAVRLGRERHQPSIVLTFDRNPLAVLAPERCPAPLASLEQNLAALSTLGVAVAIVLPFTPETARTSEEEFFRNAIVEALRGEVVVVGHDFRFGHDRAGSADWLRERIATVVIPPILHGGERISSTRIRTLVAAGRLEEAAELLGRPFAIPGVVIAGEQLGRRLGYPTLNLARSAPLVMPPDGVYAGSAETPFGTFAAAVSIGLRPTVGGRHRTIEAYLIDYPGDDLYGRSVELALLHRLRDEMSFPTLDDLRAQMARDVERVVDWHASRPASAPAEGRP